VGGIGSTTMTERTWQTDQVVMLAQGHSLCDPLSIGRKKVKVHMIASFSKQKP
jgi:hypothetical protein